MKKWVVSAVLAAVAMSPVAVVAEEGTTPVPEVSIEAHGAIANDGLDDTAAIQAAIWAAANSGVNRVLIPAGTFEVAPRGERWIEVPSNMTITGTGDASVLKVQDGVGDFHTVFGAPNGYGGYVEHLTFTKFRFDQNPRNNPGAAIQAGNTYYVQNMIAFANFYDITVDSVTFDPISGVNTVVLSGATAKKARVTNNTFRFVRGYGHERYDNSAVYLNCEDHTLSGNKFYADPAEKAFGAMETHKGPSTVTNNVSDGYHTLLHVVSPSRGQSVATPRMEVYNNEAKRANHAIRLWSITDTILKNVHIHDNIIDVAQVTHNEITSSGISMVHDSATPLRGPQDTITIENNTITFQLDRMQRTVTESNTYGIGLAPSGNINNVIVSGNKVYNAPVRGLLLGNTVTSNTSTGVQITGNYFLNPGHDDTVMTSYRQGVALYGNLNSVTVKNNEIFGALNPFRGNYGIVASKGVYNNVTVQLNKVSALYGTYLNSYQSSVIR